MEFVLEIIYLKKINDAAYVKSLDQYSDTATHCIVLYSNNINNVTYFDSFSEEHILKEIKKCIANKSTKVSTITKNIFKIQAYG